MKKNIIDYSILSSYRSDNLRVNADLDVYYGKTTGLRNIHIGNFEILRGQHLEQDDEILCFLPGGVGFAHRTCKTPEQACAVLFEKFNTQK